MRINIYIHLHTASAEAAAARAGAVGSQVSCFATDSNTFHLFRVLALRVLDRLQLLNWKRVLKMQCASSNGNRNFEKKVKKPLAISYK